MRCLDSLEQQTLPRDKYEIIVVDDHSPDDTEEWMKRRSSIHYIRLPKNRGLSSSRNAGIRAAQSDWVLFLDDDLSLMPDVLEKHVMAHEQEPGDNIAVLGHTRYAPDMEITPFMDFLWCSGRSPLVDPMLITNPNDVPFGFLHTNTSVHRGLLARAGMLDEAISEVQDTAPYGEDTELAYRLKQAGMRLIFRQEIVANHYGRLTYGYARRRAKIAGRTAILTHQKHPEWINIDFLNYGIKSRSAIRARHLVAENILDPLLIAADERRLDHPLLRRAYRFALGTHQLTAMLDQVHQT